MVATPEVEGTSNLLDLLIVGAGPAGLSAAIAAKQAGFTYLVVEKGTVVNSIFEFPRHMVFFTTPELLEIGGLPFISPYDKPTRLEALRYYRRVVESHELAISLNEEVVRIRRQAIAGQREMEFAVTTRTPEGVTRCHRARTVILAIGYFDHPNLLHVPGEELPHVSHYYQEAHKYFRREVVVVGGANSAAETALDLYRAGVRVTLVHRGAALAGIKHWVKPDIENRIKEGSIPARFNTRVVRILPLSVLVERDGQPEELPARAVFLLTGYTPDLALLRDAGVHIDDAKNVPCYDPDTFETNVRGLFLAGGVISGKDTRPIFIENGRFHGEKIVRLLTGKEDSKHEV
jgi:thioredoxin reductase (NADPH)